MKPRLAEKALRTLCKIVKTAAAWVFRFFSAKSPEEHLAAYSQFLLLSVVEIGVWACIALLTQWAEAFLNGLTLSSISRACFWLFHHLFVVRTMLHLSKCSDGLLGMTLSEVGRFLSAILRRLNGNSPEQMTAAPEGDID